LADMTIKGVDVDVVIGAQHPCRAEIETNCAALGFVCHVQTDKMAELMMAADLAIGAGGSASWERCCLGLPSLLLAFADNQVNIAKGLGLLGACIYIETFKTPFASFMQSAIISLLSKQSQLKDMSEKAYSLVDGLGVNRVMERMDEG